MHSYFLLGAAALAAANPAPVPQVFNADSVAAIPVTITNGPPVGAGPATQTAVYNQGVAQSTAAAAASAATAASANSKRSVEKRGFCIFGICIGGSSSSSSSSSSSWGNDKNSGWGGDNGKTTPAAVTPTPTPAQSYAHTTSAPVVTSTPAGVVVPSTCTPVSWTNTNSFTSDAACPTPYEVGTYCGFVNPEDPCAPQPAGSAPITSPDTPEAFEANPIYHTYAQKAATPSGYTNTFKDLNASVNANSYLGFETLTSYDVSGCSSFCDNTDLCTGFNIYIERDPAFNPDQCSCQSPSSTVNYKCSIWGSGVEASAATNFGQSRDNFDVVIVASNGYEKSTTPSTPPGYSNPQDCGAKLHDQQPYCLGQQSFPGPFDVSLCAAYATEQNAKNLKAGLISSILSFLGFSPAKCQQFQAAEITKDGAAWGTHCRLFTKKFQPSQAQYDIHASSPSWGCKRSFTWDISVTV